MTTADDSIKHGPHRVESTAGDFTFQGTLTVNAELDHLRAENERLELALEACQHQVNTVQGRMILADLLDTDVGSTSGEGGLNPVVTPTKPPDGEKPI